MDKKDIEAILKQTETPQTARIYLADGYNIPVHQYSMLNNNSFIKIIEAETENSFKNHYINPLQITRIIID